MVGARMQRGSFAENSAETPGLSYHRRPGWLLAVHPSRVPGSLSLTSTFPRNFGVVMPAAGINHSRISALESDEADP
jgi:hypothetical protein